LIRRREEARSNKRKSDVRITFSKKKNEKSQERERKRENAAAEAAEAEAARFIIHLARIAYSLIYK
jgi:hypothetical protein